MSDIRNFLDMLVGDVVDFAKDELEGLVKEAKSDSKVFISSSREAPMNRQ